MNQNVKDFVSEKVKEIISAASCCAELKAAGENWLNALGTDQEAEQTEKLMAEIEMDIMPVDGRITGRGPGIRRGPRKGSGGSRQRDQSRRSKILRLSGLCGGRSDPGKEGRAS